MHRAGICLCTAAAALLAAPLARAQGEGGMQPREAASRLGFYAGLAGAVAFDDFSEHDALRGTVLPQPILRDFDPSLGLHARGGFRMNPWFAGEVHLEWLSGFDGKADVGTQPPFPNVTFQTVALSADLKVYPLSLLEFRAQPFLTLGAGALGLLPSGAISGNEWDFIGRLGGGIDIDVTEHIALSFDATYVLPTDVLSGLDYLSVGWGALYRF